MYHFKTPEKDGEQGRASEVLVGLKKGDVSQARLIQIVTRFHVIQWDFSKRFYVCTPFSAFGSAKRT